MWQRDDRQPVDALLRSWSITKGTAGGASTAADIARLLLDPDVAVRAGAAYFFQHAPQAPAEAPLNDAYLHHYDRFVGFKNPFLPKDVDDIGFYLASAVAYRVHVDTPAEVLDRLRAEATQPGRASAIVVGPLLSREEAWFSEHMETVVAHSPRALWGYLAYQRTHRLPFDEILERVAPHCAPELLEKAIRTFYRLEPQTRQRLRALVGLEPLPPKG